MLAVCLEPLAINSCGTVVSRRCNSGGVARGLSRFSSCLWPHWEPSPFSADYDTQFEVVDRFQSRSSTLRSAQSLWSSRPLCFCCGVTRTVSGTPEKWPENSVDCPFSGLDRAVCRWCCIAAATDCSLFSCISRCRMHRPIFKQRNFRRSHWFTQFCGPFRATGWRCTFRRVSMVIPRWRRSSTYYFVVTGVIPFCHRTRVPFAVVGCCYDPVRFCVRFFRFQPLGNKNHLKVAYLVLLSFVIRIYTSAWPIFLFFPLEC